MNNYDNNYIPKFEGKLEKKMNWREIAVGFILIVALVFLLGLIYEAGSVTNYVKP